MLKIHNLVASSAETVSQIQSPSGYDYQLTRPPFPCLSCDKNFHRLHEWTRHGFEVHNPEFKQVCPHPGCDRSFSRPYRLNQHTRDKHGVVLTTHLTSTTPLGVNKQKIWGCGFCVRYGTDWKDFAKHIWSHFQAGKVKATWNNSMCIHSLLHYPSVRSDWHATMRRSIGEAISNVDQLQWSDSNVKLLREELEWDHTDRQSGYVLASKAYNLLYASNPYLPPAHGSSLPDFSNQDHPNQPIMAPKLQGLNQPSSIQATEHLPLSHPSHQLTVSTQHSNAFTHANLPLTSSSHLVPISNLDTCLESPLVKVPLNEDFSFEDLNWLDPSLASDWLDPRTAYETYGNEESFGWSYKEQSD